MCGILLSISLTNNDNNDELMQNLISSNALRGPDAAGSTRWIASSDQLALTVNLHAWVLHLRGPTTTTQPIQDKNGNILAFNGEIFGGISVPIDASDTLIVSNALSFAETETDVINTIHQLDGEWAFVFYHRASNCLYYGRDCLGRRSLLVQHPESNGLFILSSSGPITKTSEQNHTKWTELSTQGIFVMDLNLATKHWPDSSKCIRMVPWISSGPTKSFMSHFDMIDDEPTDQDLDHIDETNLSILPTIQPASKLEMAVDRLEERLSDSVRRRVENIPAPRSPSDARLAILFSGGLDCMVLAALSDRFLPPSEPIDLLNVAFENPRIIKTRTKSTSSKSIVSDHDVYRVPDRQTGEHGARELQTLFPNRVWRFVEINVPYTEAVAHRGIISSLMSPLSTVMDLSIAMAFWFASRGTGITKQDTSYIPYTSTARVLFSGLGADEQLGGYGRHRVAFKQGSWTSLVREIQHDVSRISTRNLGRDDRIMSSHGKEVRFPYLDTGVMGLLCGLPIHVKMDMRRNAGVGDKMVLRLLAATKLNLNRASAEPKRAVQFGARTAKMEDSRQRGQDLLP